MSYTAATITGTMAGGSYTPALDSTASFNLKPEYLGELYKRYGRGFGIFDILDLSGRKFNIASSTPKIIEEGALERSITLAVATAVSTAAADVVFEVATSGCYCGVGDIVVVPRAYLATAQKAKFIPALYQIESAAANASNTRFTAGPVDDTTSDIDTEIPIGAKLMVTGGIFAPGSAGPAAKASYPYEKTFYTSIKRAKSVIYGSQESEQRWTETLKNGAKGQFNKASVEMDFLLNSWMNDDLLMGQYEDSNIALTTGDSSTAYPRGTVGLLTHLYDYASKMTYTGTTFELSDLFDLKDIMLSQGVVADRALLCVGPDLNRSIQTNVGLDTLQAYSGGTDLMTTLSKMNIGFNAFQIEGINYQVQELTMLSNPEKYNNGYYEWMQRFGFVVPEAYITLRESTNTINSSFKASNLMLGFKNANGENRTRIVQEVHGINGFGKPASNAYDMSELHMLTEYALIVAKANQLIRIVSDAD
jgi:hypothetical protein